MFKALLEKQVDAVVFSGPMLRHHAAHEGQGRVKLVGPEVNMAPIAFTVQLNSPLRKMIDGALLALREDGSVPTPLRQVVWSIAAQEHILRTTIRWR